jgi:hypothetical protein
VSAPVPTVVAYIEDGGWMADFAQAENADEIQALFNTTILPLPFLAGALRSSVRDTLEQNNPGHAVVLR